MPAPHEVALPENVEPVHNKTAQIARGVAGVKSVKNDMQIK